MQGVFLDYGTPSHDDLDPTPLTVVLRGIELHDRSHATQIPHRTARGVSSDASPD
ncbi:MAG: hypothetical protein JSS24_03965 [Proteobacteria bacterium]|nr:hypothetical protein [Pseudomonadota bacterium]